MRDIAGRVVARATGGRLGRPESERFARAIAASRERLLSELRGHDGLTFVRSTGNVGDQLIFAGTRQLLRGVRYREVSLDDGLSRASGGTAVLAGGGSWSPSYHYLASVFPRLERRFDHVILLPSSFDIGVPAVRTALLGTKATLFARERPSLLAVQQLGARVSLAMDAAFYFDFRPWRGLEGEGTLLAYRTDLEASGAPIPEGNRDISLLCDSLDHWLWEIARHSVVHTDRAHVLIAAMMLGKTVRFRPSNYHKLEGIARWFRPSPRLQRDTGPGGSPLVTPPPAPVRLVELDEPVAAGNEVTVRWRVSPYAGLCPPGEFTLRFPPGFDLAPVPREVLWTAALAALHMQFALLRPCVVRLPVTLPPGHAEAWMRLVEAATWTLEEIRGTDDTARAVWFEEDGPPLPATTPLPPSDRCATPFSSGKDSLLQAGILAELTRRPLLVTVTSPLPPFVDHLTPRRRYILGEVARRRDVEHVEVETGLRTAWDNQYAAKLGYPVGVNELSDTHLYFAATLIAAAARGVTHIFMASEAEVQENAERDGRVVQHPHFMYSAATQMSVAALLRPLGIRYSSLTWPLYSAQVQELLWTRYPDIADLQYSCWLLSEGDAFCSRCEQCLRLALIGLAVGRSPEWVGLDFVRLMETMGHWLPDVSGGAGEDLPVRARTGRILHRHIVRSLKRATPPRAALALLRQRPRHAIEPRFWRAMRTYATMRYAVADLRVGPRPGYREGFLTDDPVVAGGQRRIFASAFPAEPVSVYGPVLERSKRLAAWVGGPIADAAAGREVPVSPGPSPIALPEALRGAPRVSVVIPMMDRAADLEDTLPSLLAQDYPDFEIVVPDLGSRDHLEAVLTAHADPRVVHVRLPRPEFFSFAAARNAGARAATGALLLFWNGDDRLAAPGSLALAVGALLGTRPEDADAHWFASWRASCGYPPVEAPPGSVPPLADDAFRVYAAARGSTLLVPREAFDATGGYDEWLEDWGYEDTDLLGRLELLGLARAEFPGLVAGDRGEALRVANLRHRDRDATWERNRRISDMVIAAVGPRAPRPPAGDALPGTVPLPAEVEQRVRAVRDGLASDA